VSQPFRTCRFDAVKFHVVPHSRSQSIPRITLRSTVVLLALLCKPFPTFAYVVSLFATVVTLARCVMFRVVASLAVVAAVPSPSSRKSAFPSLPATSSYASVLRVSKFAMVGSYSGPGAVNSASILMSSLGSADFLRLPISLASEG